MFANSLEYYYRKWREFVRRDDLSKMLECLLPSESIGYFAIDSDISNQAADESVRFAARRIEE